VPSQAHDGPPASYTTPVRTTVSAVNDAPVASGQDVTTDEDVALSGTVSATDVDGDGLTYALVGQAAHGTAVVNADGSFTYTPASNCNGTDSTTFKATDGTPD